MTTSDVSTAVRHRDGVAIVDLIGDVNGAAEHAMDQAWTAAAASDPSAVVLNFDQAGYINSTGIALVVALLAKARARGLPVRAYGLSAHYREIFEITRLADFMAITDDEDGALSAVEGSGA